MVELSRELVEHYAQPIQAYLEDQAVSEICVNRYDDIWIERNGKLERVEGTFGSEASLDTFIRQIANSLNQAYDETEHPILDARLENGARINAVASTCSVDGTCMSIRPFPKKLFTGEDLIERGALNQSVLSCLEMAMKHKLNIVVSGGTGSGKTTILRILCSMISERERTITIEDTCEHLMDGHPHSISMEAPKRREKEGRVVVTLGRLIKNSLRQRPDRIVVGEVRDYEAASAFVEVINTGHQGSLATIHANNTDDMLWRMAFLYAASASNFTPETLERLIRANVELAVQVSRDREGVRRIMEVAWIRPDGDKVPLYTFNPRNKDNHWESDDRILDEFRTFLQERTY